MNGCIQVIEPMLAIKQTMTFTISQVGALTTAIRRPTLTPLQKAVSC